MAKISDFSDVNISLSSSPAAQATFTTAMVLVDHSDIPIDLRYKTCTRSTYSTLFTASTNHVAWLDELWNASNTYNASEAYVGRWVSAASSPYIIFASPNETISGWTGVTTGALTITDNDTTPNTDTISSLDFSLVTDMDDICTVIQNALQAIATPNISGLDTATCVYDIWGRIIIQNSTTGAAALTITASTPGAGVDLTLAGYLGSSSIQAGLDIETQGAAATAIFALDNSPFMICEIGGTIANQVALATTLSVLDKYCELVTNDENCEDSTDTTNVIYLLKALDFSNVHVTYTLQTDEYPDAAICGEILPREEATTNFAMTQLFGLTQSGMKADGVTAGPIDAIGVAALAGFGGDYIVKPNTYYHLVSGLAPNGTEARIMIGKFFCEAKISEEVYEYMIANNVVTYSEAHLSAIKGIIIKWLDEMVRRQVLEAGYVVTMPTAASFSAATKATHIMALSNVTNAETQRSVNKITISLSWAV